MQLGIAICDSSCKEKLSTFLCSPCSVAETIYLAWSAVDYNLWTFYGQRSLTILAHMYKPAIINAKPLECSIDSTPWNRFKVPEEAAPMIL